MAYFVKIGISYLLGGKHCYTERVVKFKSVDAYEAAHDGYWSSCYDWFFQFVPDDGEMDMVEPAEILKENQVRDYINFPERYY